MNKLFGWQVENIKQVDWPEEGNLDEYLFEATLRFVFFGIPLKKKAVRGSGFYPSGNKIPRTFGWFDKDGSHSGFSIERTIDNYLKNADRSARRNRIKNQFWE